MAESLLNKEVLTTGDVARICHVAPRTVSKWFDSGQLRGYRIPGSRDRRIPVDHLRAFMRTHGIPLGDLENNACRVLLVRAGVEPDLLEQLQAQDNLTIRQAANEFVAGLEARQFHPHVVVLDATGLGDQAESLCRSIRDEPELKLAGLVAVCGDADPNRMQRLSSQGFNSVLGKPYSAQDLLRAIEQARTRGSGGG
jgi:excisionase family DNA binding protein